VVGCASFLIRTRESQEGGGAGSSKVESRSEIPQGGTKGRSERSSDKHYELPYDRSAGLNDLEIGIKEWREVRSKITSQGGKYRRRGVIQITPGLSFLGGHPKNPRRTGEVGEGVPSEFCRT